MHIGSLASSHIGLISQRQIGSLARLFFIPCYLKREITYNSVCEMHVSHLPHKLFTKYQKQLRTQPKLFEKACFLCCVVVCVRRRNEDLSRYKKSASSTNVWLFDFCLIASLLFRCIVIFFMQLKERIILPTF